MKPSQRLPVQYRPRFGFFFVIMCWLVPGIIFSVSSLFAYGFAENPEMRWLVVPIWILPPLFAAVACGKYVADHGPAPDCEPDDFDWKRRNAKVARFVFFQIFIAPCVFITFGLGCGLIV